MSARHESLRLEASGMMHDDAFRDVPDAEVGERIGRSRRTANNYRRGAPGAKGGIPDSVLTYMLSAEHPWRVAGEIEATLKDEVIEKKDDDRLIEDYWQLRQNEVELEAADRAFDSKHPDSWTWMQRARARKRDVACNAELAAHEVEMAKRGMSWQQVLAARPGPRWHQNGDES